MDGLLAVGRFTADKTNEIFYIKTIYSYTNSMMLLLLKNEIQAMQYHFVLWKSHSEKGWELPFIFNEVIKRNPRHN
jgi:transposase-like protein